MRTIARWALALAVASLLQTSCPLTLLSQARPSLGIPNSLRPVTGGRTRPVRRDCAPALLNARRWRARCPPRLRAARDDAGAGDGEVTDGTDEGILEGSNPGNILLPDGVTMDAVADGEEEPVWIFAGPGFEGMTYDEAMVMAEDAERLFSQMLGDLPDSAAVPSPLRGGILDPRGSERKPKNKGGRTSDDDKQSEVTRGQRDKATTAGAGAAQARFAEQHRKEEEPAVREAPEATAEQAQPRGKEEVKTAAAEPALADDLTGAGEKTQDQVLEFEARDLGEEDFSVIWNVGEENVKIDMSTEENQESSEPSIKPEPDLQLMSGGLPEPVDNVQSAAEALEAVMNEEDTDQVEGKARKPGAGLDAVMKLDESFGVAGGNDEEMMEGFSYEDIQRLLADRDQRSQSPHNKRMSEDELPESEAAIDVAVSTWEEETQDTDSVQVLAEGLDKTGRPPSELPKRGEADAKAEGASDEMTGGEVEAKEAGNWNEMAARARREGLSEFGNFEALRRVFGFDGYSGGLWQNQSRAQVPLNEAGPNVAEWENKTYMNEIALHYWNRTIADRPPRDPLPAFDGDVTIDELLEAMGNRRQEFFDRAKEFKDDDLAFTNFMRASFHLGPLEKVAPENQTAYDELNRSLAEATEVGDWETFVRVKEAMEKMTYVETMNSSQQEQADEEWYVNERLKAQGLAWDTDEELLELVDRENAEYLAKLARLGEVFDEATGTFSLRSIPFTPTGGDEFDSKLIGADLDITNNGKTITRQAPGRPTYALWGRGGRVDGDSGVDAPIEGLARKLATRSWFINSAGEAMRTGPSTKTDNHEYVEKENMTWMHAETQVWEEGHRVNPAYRKPGCDMVVDPQSGETAWVESDRLRDEALSYQGHNMMQQMTESVALQLMMQFGPELVEACARRWLAIEERRHKPTRDNNWQEESWEACFGRSHADGYWRNLTRRFPVPDFAQLGYRNYTNNLDGLISDVQTLLQEDAKKVAEELGFPEEWVYGQRELCSVQRLAKMDILRFGPLCFQDLMTDAQPSVVRLELDRRAGTLHVRVDDRPESFLFRNVSVVARPFVNLCAVGDSVTILDE